MAVLDAAQTWTLAFRDAALEGAFRLDRASAGQRAHRTIWILGTLVCALYVVADIGSAGTPGNFRVLETVRFGAMVPVLSAVAAFGWASVPTFARWRSVVVTIGSMMVLLGPMAMGWLMPDPDRFLLRDATLSLAFQVFVVCTLCATRFAIALFVLVSSTLLGVVADANGLGIATRVPNWPGLLFLVALTMGLALFAISTIEQAQREAFVARRAVERERARADDLLVNVLPASIAERLKASPSSIAEHFDEVTVLFGDIVGFTSLSASMSPGELVAALDEMFSAFDEIAHRHGLEKIKTIGDAYMAVGGVPTPRADHAEAVATMALEMRDLVAETVFGGGQRLGMRIGLHTGPVVAGVIGKKKFSYDLWGDTVNTASRMESHGIAGAIQVTEATYQKLKDAFDFEDRGLLAVKGKGEMRTLLLKGRAGLH